MPRWHPVARSADLRPGANIVAGFAEGQELALWRSAGGAAQAWDNRCPHRSVRFTLGQVIEDRLACAYHGWQYAAGNGQCVEHSRAPGDAGAAQRLRQGVRRGRCGRHACGSISWPRTLLPRRHRWPMPCRPAGTSAAR
jgi:phenylpropionate dioxygenase-like ring-hydroxylating dioxygenase large terminal subunit